MMIRCIALLAAAVLLSGCGGNDRGAQQAGQKVGETITDFASGVGKGIDKRMEVPVELSDSITALGLRHTIAKSLGIDRPNEKGVTVYFIAAKPVEARLMAKALNAEGQEIGRSTADVELAADDARYITFRFDPELDAQLVERYLIEAKPTPPAGDSPSTAPESAESAR
jgi:hypothetical protein